jgi:hypothetical protein
MSALAYLKVVKATDVISAIQAFTDGAKYPEVPLAEGEALKEAIEAGHLSDDFVEGFAKGAQVTVQVLRNIFKNNGIV